MRSVVIITVCFCMVFSIAAGPARGASVELEKAKPQVPLAGQVVKKRISPELFYEKEQNVITPDSLLQAGYLAYNDHPFGNIIDFELDNKDAAAPGDVIFINRGSKDGVKTGQRYFIYKKEETPLHPETDETYGYLVSIIGLIEIADVKEDGASAKVVKAFDMIFRENDIMPEFTVKATKVDPDRPVTNKTIGGVILAVKVLGKGELSEGDYVYLSVGKQDGVEEADIFDIYSVNNKTGESGKFGIGRKVGKARVVLVRGDSATASVYYSTAEIKVGDKVTFVQER